LLDECKTLFGAGELYKVFSLEKLDASANDSRTFFSLNIFIKSNFMVLPKLQNGVTEPRNRIP
jgi:hypothetical protein